MTIGLERFEIENKRFFRLDIHDILWSIETLDSSIYPKSDQEIHHFVETDNDAFMVLPLYAYRMPIGYGGTQFVFVVLFHNGIGIIPRGLDKLDSLGGIAA